MVSWFKQKSVRVLFTTESSKVKQSLRQNLKEIETKQLGG